MYNKYTHRTSNFSPRQGFTLVETVVVISISVILLSLLVVAVQQVRSTTRNLTCKNNLKQIGLALANYESANRCLPAANALPSAASPFVVLLPFLELSHLYDQFDLSQGIHGTKPISSSPAARVRIVCLRCPASPNSDRTRTDYVINRGTTLALPRNDPWFAFEHEYPRLSQFSKGTTGTTLMSEFCSFVPGAIRGGYTELPPRGILNSTQSDQLANECAVIVGQERFDKRNGDDWWGGGTFNYYHILAPNRNSCFNGNTQYSVDTANSMHSGGVNALFADGRIEFISDNIDLTIWKSTGTR
jgi:prepilin-type N-terminal cleavage/methylation domain-containing protein/prepilin-type processing-associated H-X9-DG protein